MSDPQHEGEATLPGEVTTTCDTDLAAHALDAPPPERIGPFVVEGVLGAGAMGVVLRAHDPELQRTVAIKLLTPRYGDDERARQRLLREAQSVAQLAHPNVVAVHQAGVHGGRVYVVMEYVDGGTLREWVAARPRTWTEIVDAYVQAARGLAAAHAVGFVHRDFKPDNVLIGSDGRVRVSDFGLVRAEPEELETSKHSIPDVRLTQTGALLGTPAYMAPEQFSGTDVGPAADQFAFCVALFEALHGCRPFAGVTPQELILAMEAGKREAPANPDVPDAIDRALAVGTAYDPADRHASMAAVIGALAPAPASRWPWLTLGAAVLAISGVIALALAARPSDESPYPCVAGGATVPAAWNDSALERLSAGLTEAGFADPAPLVARADALAHDRGAALWRVRNEICTATDIRPEDLAREQHCLRLQADAFDETIAMLVDASPAIARDAVVMLTDLPSPDACLDSAALQAREQPPGDAVYGDRRALYRARRAHSRGDATTAAEIAGPIRDATSDPVSRSIAARVLARIKLDESNLLAANELVIEALRSAREAKDAAEEWRALLLQATIFSRQQEYRGRVASLVETATESAAAVGERGDFEFMFDAANALRYSDVEKAHAHAEAAIDAARAQPVQAPQRVAGALALAEAMRFRQNTQQAANGVPDLRAALEVAERGLGPAHPVCASLKLALASRFAVTTDFASATRLLAEALTALGPEVGNNRERRGETLLLEAHVRTILGEVDAAAAAAQKAFEIFKDRPAYRPQQIRALERLGAARFFAGDAEAADDALSRAARLAEPYAGTEAVDWVQLLHTWGGAKMLRRDYEGTLAQFTAAKDWLESKHGMAHVELVIAYTHIGDALLVMRRCEEAIAAYSRARRIRIDLDLVPDDHLLRAEIGLAICHGALGDLEAARDGLARVGELRDKGRDPYELYRPWESMITAEIEWQEGNRAAARKVAADAAAAYRLRGPVFGAYVVAIEDWLAAHPG